MFKKLRLSRYLLFVTLFTLLIYHFPLWRYLHTHAPQEAASKLPLFIGLVFALGGITLLLYGVFAFLLGRHVRYIVAILSFLSGIALYFIDTYGVILDRSMMGNVFNTNWGESSAFLGWRFFAYSALAGLLPAWIAWRAPIVKIDRIKTLLVGLGGFGVSVAVLYLNASTWPWFDKHAKYIGGMALPWSFTINSIRHIQHEIRKNRQPILLPTADTKDNTPRLVVVIIGESARVHNFSLYGYTRSTNPKLQHLDVFALKGAQSASTYTTASLSAMLSFNQADTRYETFPEYFERMGVDTLWLANNSGAPHMRLSRLIRSHTLRRNCRDESCDYDGVLLKGLRRWLGESNSSKRLAILHTSGSHGPNYATRYPPSFERFKPACKQVDLKSCTPQSLINAYDNTIVYTDHLIAQTIKMLQDYRHLRPVLIYLSDHGESLGEGGLYLHGTPYAIAPEYQKKIPYIVWFGDHSEKDRLRQNLSSLPAVITHATLPHTVMGLLGFQGSVYNQSLDLFAPTRLSIP